MMSSEVLLKVEDLNIEFHDHNKPETVVYDFDLKLSEGEIVGLVGESGSGKSMSAKAIAGLLNRKDVTCAGKIMFGDVDMLHANRNQIRSIQGDDISMIFQEPLSSLNPVYRIQHQIEEPLKIHNKELTDAQRYEKALKALYEVELSNPEQVMRQYPHELSGGMRQRVMIAMAMITEPKILIADEPTTALDVTVQAQIVKLLMKLNKEHNTAILFISHDLSLVQKLCQRVLVMKDGRVVEEGDCQKVFSDPKEEYTKKLIAAIPKLPKFD